MKLSIITVNLNNKDGLQKTIDSVISQTFKDFEWIVIDGGSTDGSKELIEKYSDYISYWVSEPDKGVYNAMNKGIQVAKGEYLNFMNSGDSFICETTLQDVFSKNMTADINAGPVVLSNGTRLYQCKENLVKLIVCSNICHQSTFFKHILFEHRKYDEGYRIVSDWAALADWILFENRSLSYMDVDVALYDITGISGDTQKLREERQSYLRSHFGDKVATELPRLYKEQDYLKGELEIPAIKMLRYLYYKAPRWFSVAYRLVSLIVKMKDFVCRTSSFRSFQGVSIV